MRNLAKWMCIAVTIAGSFLVTIPTFGQGGSPPICPPADRMSRTIVDDFVVAEHWRDERKFLKISYGAVVRAMTDMPDSVSCRALNTRFDTAKTRVPTDTITTRSYFRVGEAYVMVLRPKFVPHGAKINRVPILVFFERPDKEQTAVFPVEPVLYTR